MLQSFIEKNTLNHVAFVATINCFLNLCSINKIGCQRVNYPVDKWWVINAALTPNPEDDVRSESALRNLPEPISSGGDVF